jgi:hypothetical protein
LDIDSRKRVFLMFNISFFQLIFSDNGKIGIQESSVE